MTDKSNKQRRFAPWEEGSGRSRFKEYLVDIKMPAKQRSAWLRAFDHALQSDLDAWRGAGWNVPCSEAGG